MARIAGRFGRLYVAIASNGTAEPIPFVAKWTVDQKTDRFDATALGDTSKSYVAGLPDAQGTYNGFLDTATAQTFTAAADGIARKFYQYSNTNDGSGGQASPYWFGTAFFDASATGDV